MEELDAGKYLSEQDLFELFKQQLKKDFEGAGINGEFADTLPRDFQQLKAKLITELRVITNRGTQLPGLLYRVDISELQLKKHHNSAPTMDFEEAVAELVIKRILQKIILKKKFSA